MLAGRGILVTRPRHQAAGLADLIVAQGGDPFLFPTIAIAPPGDPSHAMALLAGLAAFDHVIFASANAVTFGLAIAPLHWPGAVTAIAVGPATAKALQVANITQIMTPAERFDSEGVLELAALAAPRGKRVLIVRGVGGRGLLERSLTERGASVDIAEVYERHDPRGDPRELVGRLRDRRIHAVICAASESVRNLFASLGADRQLVEGIPFFVPHARIARTVKESIRTDVIETATGDDAIVQAIDHFFAKVTG